MQRVTLTSLTGADLERFASRANARRVAVENFLGTLDGLTYTEALKNLEADRKGYGWKSPTVSAILAGLNFAERRAQEVRR